MPNSATPLTVNIAGKTVPDGRFLGFGAQWDSQAYAESGVTDTDMALIQKRLAWMRMPIVRMAIHANWCYLGNNKYDWNSRQMQTFYRNLDVCEKLGITVILNDWGVEPDWLHMPDVKQVDDPKVAEIIGTYLDHLLNVKKYHCIRYFIFVNEPSNEVRNPVTREPEFPRWLKGATQVANEIHRRKLNDRLAFVGPDISVTTMWAEAHTELWMLPTLEKASHILDGYDIHHYAQTSAISNLGIRDYIGTAWKMVRDGDKDHAKPLLLTEAGYWVNNADPAQSTSYCNNPLSDNWQFGLQMAQYASQSIAAGSWAVVAWMLDDTSYNKFNFGLWKHRKEGYALRPWFYVWSLLVRSFPPGSSFIAIDPPAPNIQLLAARVPGADGKLSAWAFCIVNDGKSPASLHLQVPGNGDASLERYLYGETERRCDGDGFPVSVDVVASQNKSGWQVECPPETVTFLVPPAIHKS